MTKLDIVVRLQCLLDDISLPRNEHDTIAAAADEIERLRGIMCWQPIKIAPTDGTKFLAYQRDADAQYYECFWQADFPVWGGWQTVWDNEPAPTDWMPLPAPPSEKDETQ